MSEVKTSRVLALAAAMLLLALPPLSAASILGQVGTNGTSVNGHWVPSGTTLLSDSVVATAEYPAVVHLNNGQTLRLGEASRALFQVADAGLEVHVQAGTVAFNGGAGEAITLAPKSVLVLDQQGQAQEGTRVNRAGVRVCDLRSAETGEYFTSSADIAQCHAKPGGDECAWGPDEVPQSELESYLDHGAVQIGFLKKLNDLCEATGGFTWWKATLIGVGAAGAVAVADDDDTRRASPDGS
ncbi:MAG: hypothetical protein VYE73_10510 [Acidobacteriota bacterium]|nr:hypothetical protein [Acidobacteriota bacterium]